MAIQVLAVKAVRGSTVPAVGWWGTICPVLAITPRRRGGGGRAWCGVSGGELVLEFGCGGASW